MSSLTVQAFSICQKLAGIESEASLYAALDEIVEDLVKSSEMDAAALVIRKSHQPDFKSYLHDLHTSGLTQEERKHFGFFLAKTLVLELTESRQVLIRDDVRLAIMGNQAAGLRSKMVSMLAAPMVVKGEIAGVLTVFRSEIGAFCFEDKAFLMRMASLIAEDIENSSAYLRIAKDQATGFYNRRVFFEALAHEIARARRYQAPMSAVILEAEVVFPPESDLAKSLEAFLKRFSSRVLAETRQSDIVARISDSAFLFLQPMTTTQSALEFAQRVCEHFKQHPLTWNDSVIPIKLSAGVSSLKSDDDDGMALLKRADNALDLARKKGQGVVALDV